MACSDAEGVQIQPPQNPEGAVAERRAILASAQSVGWWEVDRAWIENARLSESDLQRPGIDGALDALHRRKARALVVVKVDSSATALSDLVQLMDSVTRQHWALVALEPALVTAQGNALLATLVPYERRFLAERTRAALAARKAAGLHIGRERAVPDEIVRRIMAERQAGASLYAIASRLNADGIMGSARGRWHASTVRYVLMGVERDAGSPASSMRHDPL